MLNVIKTVVGQLNTRFARAVPATATHGGGAVGEDGVRADETTADSVATAVPPHLYDCPSCERVFVATDKRTCATCEVPVERVE